ncbi:hypothetical protein CAEBREN_14829 [Caenorhabditis brenneri]|uniref:Uncharacterized protein n=1 Tax=Caenorhabditis brenneri TaxID=135651 RepID=G0N1J5_CAEBE|nr:hypothetical protein CAEBREN_14829 [Caenorhabditis brenneri]
MPSTQKSPEPHHKKESSLSLKASDQSTQCRVCTHQKDQENISKKNAQDLIKSHVTFASGGSIASASGERTPQLQHNKQMAAAKKAFVGMKLFVSGECKPQQNEKYRTSVEYNGNFTSKLNRALEMFSSGLSAMLLPPVEWQSFVKLVRQCPTRNL